MATIWSKRNNNNLNTGSNNRSAPCTIFSTTTLSPRQIANKAYTLGCKKLDRDDKRSKQRYHVRERLLLCNTIAKAEEVLNARTRRTNRRVMAAEDEEEASSDEFSMKHHHNNGKEHHSPLRSSASEDDEEEEEKEKSAIETTTTHNNNIIPTNNNASLTTHISSSTTSSSLLPRDCRVAITNTANSNSNNSPIATTII